MDLMPSQVAMRRKGGHEQEWCRARIRNYFTRVCMSFVTPSGRSIEIKKAKIEIIEIGKMTKLEIAKSQTF
jgi:hypothetical protein